MMRLWVVMLALLGACWANERTPATPPSSPLLPRGRAAQLVLDVEVDRFTCFIGYPGEVSLTDLHVPVGRSIRLRLTSRDVEHEVVFGDAFGTEPVRVKPRETSEHVVEAGREGAFAWRCPSDRTAPSEIIVESADAFASFVAELQREQNPVTREDRIALGRKLYERKGCVSCHSVDGTQRVGPSWRSIWGTEVTLADGTTRMVDAAYIQASIETPSAFARAGFPPGVMPSFQGQLRPGQITSLAAYIESLGN